MTKELIIILLVILVIYLYYQQKKKKMVDKETETLLLGDVVSKFEYDYVEGMEKATEERRNCLVKSNFSLRKELETEKGKIRELEEEKDDLIRKRNEIDNSKRILLTRLEAKEKEIEELKEKVKELENEEFFDAEDEIKSDKENK
jgi:hypothetical protein